MVGGYQGDYRSPGIRLTYADQQIASDLGGADGWYWVLPAGVSGTLYRGVVSVTDIGVGCRVSGSVAQSIPNNAATALTFDTTSQDPFGMHDPGVNPTRITAPVPGWYSAGGAVRWNPHATGYRSLVVRVNGAVQVGKELGPPDVIGNNTWQTINVMVYLNAGDYVEILAIQTSGAALDAGINPSNSPEGWLVKVQ
jgi:hypothetical protein